MGSFFKKKISLAQKPKNSRQKLSTVAIQTVHEHFQPRSKSKYNQWEMLERVELSIQIHYCMRTLQSIMNDVQRLVYSRGAVVIVRQLAQLVRNSLPTLALFFG